MIVPDVRLFTPTEAAAVSGLGLKAVNNLIDKQIVHVARPSTGTRATRRYLTHHHLVVMYLEQRLAGSLTLETRQHLYREVSAKPDATVIKAHPILHVDVGEASKAVDARVDDLREAEALIVADAGILAGEPVFKGTRVPVHAVASMLGSGASPQELQEGYPALTCRMLDLARIWAAAHPRRGRPKRLSDHGVQPLSIQDVALGEDPLAARPRTARSR